MKKSVLLFALFISSFFTQAQEHDHRFCGQVEAGQRLRSKHADRIEEIESAEAWLEEYTRNFSEDRGGGMTIYTIPVVFHVIHDNGPENITDDQILNGLSILNRDFRMLNNDIALVVDEFQGITADIGIEFALATKDPNGNCTRGINRVVSDLTNAGDDEMKSLIYWPRDEYLNIWICADAAGAAGYTQLPAQVSSPWAASGDGIVVRADYVGAIGTSSNTRSRTLTHEVGHWLNLSHTWGPTNEPGLASNCDFDDGVSDTPNTIGYTSCTITGSSCGNTLDNVQNYMEYSYCSRMFTQGQANRMRAAITSPIAQRNQLITASNLAATGVTNPPLCAISFELDQRSVCPGTGVQFTDRSYHGVTEWTWDFGDGTVITGTDPATYQNPLHIYDTPGTFSVSLTVSNPTGTLTTTYVNLVSVVPDEFGAPPISEGFEGQWTNENWSISNENFDETWEITPSTSYSGSKSLKLRNFNSTLFDNRDEVYSRTFDMSNVDTVYISYKWAYANKLTATDDRLRINVSPDCGENWYLVRIRKGLTNLPTGTATNTSWTPADLSQWNGEVLTITDSTYLTDAFRVKFEFLGRGGNNFYLDDINISTSLAGLGLNEMDNINTINVYPSPSKADATLELSMNTSDQVQINLYNMAGSLCENIHSGSLTPGDHRLNIAHQASGVYLLRIVSSTGVTTRKITFE